eukprot:GGOE01032229.1.p5 GENE.GGOE01032229.1~~GGOE01032229.1.p5  ORF type:complete len:138 (-),score=15.31 GGOE01032229.1:189-602(-)
MRVSPQCGPNGALGAPPSWFPLKPICQPQHLMALQCHADSPFFVICPSGILDIAGRFAAPSADAEPPVHSLHTTPMPPTMCLCAEAGTFHGPRFCPLHWSSGDCVTTAMPFDATVGSAGIAAPACAICTTCFPLGLT